ncbi:MAG: hypothetical protein KKI08_07375 [Armatimonadetes bacterium]|nr:hypothetical protein [Armatimonadota bacterium]
MRPAPGRRLPPPLRFVLVLGFAIWLSAPAGAWAARFLQFEALARQQGVELVAAGKLVLRVRPGMQINGGVAGLADELNRLAFAGLKPGDLSVRTVAAGAQIVVGGKPLVTIDKASALLGGSTPAGLADNWLSNLKAVLVAPYVVLDPRTRMQVPLGETRTLRWGGTAAVDLTFATGDANVAGVQLDEAGASLVVRGVGLGTTSLTATIPGDTARLTVEVKAWAARVGGPAVAEVTAPPIPADDLRRTLRNAVLSVTRPAPGASVQLGEPRGGGTRYAVPLRAAGDGCFDISATVPVDLKVVTLPTPTVRQLLVSNMPERVTEPATLLRERLLGTAPVRLLWHHVNSCARALRFVVRVVNLGEAPARLHVTESASGPHDDEIFVGHQAMMRFLGLTAQGEGYLLNVPAGRMLDLYDVRLDVSDIVSGLAQVTPLEGKDLLLEVLAEDAWPTDAYFPPVPDRLRSDPPLTPYRYEAAKEVALAYEVGGAWGFYSIGRDFSTNLQGQKLFGDYGVLYTITITCKNPTAEAARCYLTFRAGGGVARASYFLHGKLTETGLLHPGSEEVLERLDLKPGEERVVKLVTMPESGSNYPITLTVRN